LRARGAAPRRPFDRLAADYTTATLLGANGDDAIARVSAGERWLTL
jgi:hypothetical protein